jgi:hypothetical protein
MGYYTSWTTTLSDYEMEGKNGKAVRGDGKEGGSSPAEIIFV